MYDAGLTLNQHWVIIGATIGTLKGALTQTIPEANQLRLFTEYIIMFFVSIRIYKKIKKTPLISLEHALRGVIIVVYVYSQ